MKRLLALVRSWFHWKRQRMQMHREIRRRIAYAEEVQKGGLLNVTEKAYYAGAEAALRAFQKEFRL